MVLLWAGVDRLIVISGAFFLTKTKCLSVFQIFGDNVLQSVRRFVDIVEFNLKGGSSFQAKSNTQKKCMMLV